MYYNVVTQLGANTAIILGVSVNLFTTFLCITFHSSTRFQIALECRKKIGTLLDNDIEKIILQVLGTKRNPI